MKTVAIITTAGTVTAQVQIVGPGGGRGRDQLTHALTLAQDRRWSAIGIVHDLRGRVRNCGCSTGSLGGVAYLAGLPAMAATTAPGVTTRWVLTGDADGATPGTGAALTRHGWVRHDPAVRATEDPAAFLGLPGVSVVVTTQPTGPAHRRLVRPAATEGLAVDVVLVDEHGEPQERVVVPVDDSLDARSEALAGLAAPSRIAMRLDADPSADCRSCHQAAHGAWAGSAHARAFASLRPEDRDTTCATCHSTPLPGETARAPQVHCQACHQGGAAHAGSGGAVRTTGSVDCRSCHDAGHHPGFQRDAWWAVIRHGR